MSRVSSRDTLPEMRIRRAAHALGLRYRLYRKDLPGNPDLIFPKHRVALFVHGCFWHRHLGCMKASTPKSRTEFWNAKFDANVARDRRSFDALIVMGWRVEVIWECETRDVDDLRDRLIKIFSLSKKENVKR